MAPNCLYFGTPISFINSENATKWKTRCWRLFTTNAIYCKRTTKEVSQSGELISKLLSLILPRGYCMPIFISSRHREINDRI